MKRLARRKRRVSQRGDTMEIIVKENDVIRSQYSSASWMRYLYAINIFVAIGALSTKTLLAVVISSVQLYVFGLAFLRPLRISSFSDDSFTSSWPQENTRGYDEIRRIINLSPYEESLFFLIIVYKKGILFEKINMAWIPTDQGILEHLKARGVKVWNLWFWQEK
jgi:hypothetical protein